MIVVRVTVNIAGCAPALCSRLVCSGVLLGRVFFLLGFSCAGGVRPAAHLSLSSLLSAAGSVISASVASAATDRAQVDTPSAIYQPNQAAITINYTANPNNYISSITLNNTVTVSGASISTSKPASYSALAPSGSTIAQYKIWRSAANRVSIELYGCTPGSQINLIGNAAPTINVTNGASGQISSLAVTRADYNTKSATITATYAAGYYPRFQYDSSQAINVSTAAGSGQLGTVKYSFTYDSNQFILTFTNIPTGVAGIPTVTLSTRTLDTYQITVNIDNATYEVLYDSAEAIINVMPNDTFYVHSVNIVGGNSEMIEYYLGTLKFTGNAFAITYLASDSTSKVKFTLYDLTGDVTINITTVQGTKPVLKAGGAGVSGTVVTATNGGEARIVGFDYADENIDNVTVIAVSYAGYNFAGWSVGGDMLDITTYGASARIPYDLAKDQIITAVFTPVDSSITNDETDNGFADIV